MERDGAGPGFIRRSIRGVNWRLRSGAQYVQQQFGSMVFNERLMRSAESYLRRYYSHDTDRLWGGRAAPPEWFDHRADLYRFTELRVPFWTERGVFSREVMFGGCRVLDLCCGDGFYPYCFYSGTVSHIDAVDIDPASIAHARKWHNRPNITFAELDIVKDEFPETDYDVIVWDGAIEHFSTDNIRSILRKCAKALKAGTGVVCGYTLIARSADKSHPEHEHEFTSAAELTELLREFFPFVGTVETEYTERHNIYFRAAFQQERLRRF